MSLYNMVHGMNPHAGLILAALGLGPQDFDRFRDVRVAGGEIAIYAHIGGPNRSDHEAVYEYMATHPSYLRVEDASHDSTYATFFFSFPAEHKENLDAINAPEPFDPAKEFEQMMDNLKKLEIQANAFRGIATAIEKIVKEHESVSSEILSSVDGKTRAPIANHDGMTKMMGEIGEKLGIEPKR